jgi:hypothetical protein
MTIDSRDQVNAPTRVAALTAIRDAIDLEIKADKLEAVTFAQEFRIKSFDTQLGAVNVVRKDPAVGWDDTGLLAWVEANHPGEVEQTRRVRPAFQAVLAKRFVIVAGDVVDSATGQVLDFAYVTEAGEPYASWPASVKQKEAKETARRVVTARALGWAKAVLEIEATS